jgi:hypothetical protein
MDPILIANILAVIAVLGTAVVFGTDVFCAVVLRPALSRLDDNALVLVTGYVHRYGDRRMPIPGVLAIAATTATVVLAVTAGHLAHAAAAATALIALLIWLLLYIRISAPINRQLTAAAESGRTLANGRALQAKWDSIIYIRAALQGFAVVALCCAAIL